MVFYMHTQYTKIYTKYIENILDIYKTPGGGQAAAALPGPEQHGPARCKMKLGAKSTYAFEICFN